MNVKQQGHKLRMDATRAFIRKYWEDHHYAPTIAEIAQGLGGISTNTVSYYLRELIETGWLEPREQGTGRGYGAARNIVPTEIFANRPVFPRKVESAGPTLSKEEIKKGELLIERMSDSRIAIVIAQPKPVKESDVRNPDFLK